MRSDRSAVRIVLIVGAMGLLGACGGSDRSSPSSSGRSSAPTSAASTAPPSPTTSATTTEPPTTAPTPATATTTAAVPSTDGPVVYHLAQPGVSSDHLIQPTAIVLHWWGYDGGNDIQSLVNGLVGQVGYYDQSITKAQYEANVASGQHGHTLGVQVGILDDGTVYQLTPRLNSYAAHAACANPWAIGIEIEASGPTDLRAHSAQFQSVVDTVADLMARFHIPLDGPLAADGRSGSGVHSHKEIDVNCTFADGAYAGQGKSDVDDGYLAMVKDDLRKRGLG